MNKVLIRVSRQKIYDSLLTIDVNYQTFHGLCVFAFYSPYIRIRLVFIREEYARRDCWIENVIELTECLRLKSIYEITNSIALVLEKWIKVNKFYYYQPDIYSDYLKKR